MTQTSDVRLAQLPPWEGGKGVESEAKTKHVTKGEHAAGDDSPTVCDAVAAVQQHFNPGQDVVLRSEYIPEKQFKGLAVGISVVNMLGMMLGWAIIVIDNTIGDSHNHKVLHHPVFQCINLAVGVVCMVGLTAAGAFFCRRIWQARQTGKTWAPRRLRILSLVAVRLTVMYTAVVMFVVVNLYLVAAHCRWFQAGIIAAGVLQWSCVNTMFLVIWVHASCSLPYDALAGQSMYGHQEATVLDAPWSCHWPKLLLWLFTEGVIIALGVLTYNSIEGAEREAARLGSTCRTGLYDCRPDIAQTVLYGLMTFAFSFYVWRAGHVLRVVMIALRLRPYHEMRQTRHNVKMQIIFDSIAASISMVAVPCAIWIGYGTCASYLQFWLGSAPIVFILSGVTAAYAYVTMPVPRSDNEVLQIWLQEFSWTEDGVDAAKAQRGSSLALESTSLIAREPMFCFETALKLLYWTRLMYQYEEAEKPKLTIEEAMELYGLKSFELLWERERDTKALIAWNDDTVVLAFRGTASLRNVIADIQAWRAAYPPKRGTPLLGTRPYVHAGFLRSWNKESINDGVVSRVRQVVSCMEAKGRRVRVLVTGHSLGGALATLAALAIRRACPEPMVDLSCYVFGAPRTGNHAFAREYNAAVPDTWSIINDQDAVVHRGKMFVLYKRPGHRVIINMYGDMIVRPSFAEASTQKHKAAVSHHLLGAYQKSLVEVIRAQQGCKAAPGGLAGVQRLRASGALDAASLNNMSAEDILDKASEVPIRRRSRLKKSLYLFPNLQLRNWHLPVWRLQAAAQTQLGRTSSEADEERAGSATVDAELAEGGDVELGSGKAVPATAEHGAASRIVSWRWLPSLGRISQEGDNGAAGGRCESRADSGPARLQQTGSGPGVVGAAAGAAQKILGGAGARSLNAVAVGTAAYGRISSLQRQSGRLDRSGHAVVINAPPA